MKRLLFLAAALMMGAAAVKAQPSRPQLEFGGVVLGQDVLWSTDLANLSRTHAFGTARAMGMGGAMTSLGADLTSMSMNPAGLGMYNGNDVSVSPIVSVTSASTPGTRTWQKNDRTRFAAANFGAAINVLENSRSSLTSLTLGFGLNRIADFNTRTSFSSESRFDNANPKHYMPTIADIFAQQLGEYGVRQNDKGAIFMEDHAPNLWPAILGYDVMMVSNLGTQKDPRWVPEFIGSNASVLHSLEMLNKGSINEFDISMGANFNNVIYVGATLGVQSVSLKREVIYQEEYGYFNSEGGNVPSHDGEGRPLSRELLYSNLYQGSALEGSGINFKLGVIVRPTQGLRIGVAFHSPTYYSLDRSYNADMTSELGTVATGEVTPYGNYAPGVYDEGDNSWDFISPSRLLVGASYTLGKTAILSVDYERAWYNGIRAKNTPYNTIPCESYNNEFRDLYQGNNTLRAGLEVRPLPMLALRVGGGYSDSMLRDEQSYVTNPNAGMPPVTKSYYFSTGLGFSLGHAYFDFAYQNLTEKSSDYQLFFSGNPSTGEIVTESGLYNTRFRRHFVSLTLGFRF